MFKPLVILSSLIALSGCSLLNIDQYHQETLKVIQHSQKQNDEKFASLEDSIQQQNSQIISLQNTIADLEKGLAKLNKQIKQKASKAVANTKTKNAISTTGSGMPRNEILLGAVEHVVIDTVNQTFDARVDTGAATSSLNAINIQEFERNGKDWVKFQLDEGEGAKETSQWIEARVVRYVRIRQSTSEESERRVVVELWVTLGSIHEKAEFTLADRSMMTNPILLGREFIRDIALVDVSRKYIHTRK